MTNRYAKCDDTCTVDCGACKGAGRPTPDDYRTDAYARMRAEGEDPLTPVYAADVTREPTGGQELREALERLAAHKIAYVNAPQLWGRSRVVDAVLALPELAALIADADNWRRVTTGDPTEPLPLAMQARELLVRCRELEATVARVRGLVEWNKRMAGRYQANGTVIANDLTQALDGEPQP